MHLIVGNLLYIMGKIEIITGYYKSQKLMQGIIWVSVFIGIRIIFEILH